MNIPYTKTKWLINLYLEWWLLMKIKFLITAQAGLMVALLVVFMIDSFKYVMILSVVIQSVCHIVLISIMKKTQLQKDQSSYLRILTQLVNNGLTAAIHVTSHKFQINSWINKDKLLIMKHSSLMKTPHAPN